MAAAAMRPETQRPEPDPQLDDNDEDDAEGEDDPMIDVHPLHADTETFAPEDDESDLDAEGEEVEEVDDAGQDAEGDEMDEDGDDEEVNDDDEIVEDDGEAVGPVKLPGKRASSASDDEGDGDTGRSADDASSADEDEDASHKASSSASDSDAEAEWAEASDRGDAEVGEEAEIANPNRCIFCGEDEEKDPSEDFEEYLACAVCGDNSHRQCARNADSLESDEGAEKWRCPGCVENALEPNPSDDATAQWASSSAPKLARDLLPSQRGASRPDSHSVFNQLIVNDDPMDGSRLLRKRKASTDEAEEFATTPGKRRRRKSGSRSVSGISARSVAVATDDEEEEKFAVSSRPDTAEQKVPDVVMRDASESPRPMSRSSRPRQPRKIPKASVTVIKKRKKSLILAFHVESALMARILTSQPKKSRRRAPRTPASAQLDQFRDYAPPYTTQYATPFYSFHERENDELKSKPYGGILSEADADTSKTMPEAVDRERFDEAKQKAEEEWKQKLANGIEDTPRQQKVAGPASKIQCINFGGFEIDTWYAAPYPEEYSRNRVLYICEFCLKYMSSEYVAWRHNLKCPAKHPPGDEIYREGSVSVFEVDGRKNPVYCQNLCLLAKLFLGSKTLYYDVEPFLFYVMTEYDELGCHFVGYFSKEKRPSSSNNVSCILTLPIHQRKGYGNLLIDFSYLLTRVEQKTGSPEKPLSDMGLVSYRNYWRLVLAYHLRHQKTPLTIIEISERTGMTADDIVAALEGIRALVRDPITGCYALRLDYTYLTEYVEKWESKRYVRLNPESLVWTPYIVGRNNLVNFESAPHLATIAAREGDDNDDAELDSSGERAPIVPEEGVQLQLQLQMEEERVRELASSAAINGLALPNGTSADSSATDTNPSSFPLTPAPTTAEVEKPPSLTDTPNPAPSAVATPAIPPSRYELYPPLHKARSPFPAAASAPRRHRASAPFASLGRRKTTAGGTGSGRGGRGTHSTAAAVAASAIARRKRKEAALALKAAAEAAERGEAVTADGERLGKGGVLGKVMGMGKGVSAEVVGEDDGEVGGDGGKGKGPAGKGKGKANGVGSESESEGESESDAGSVSGSESGGEESSEEAADGSDA